MNRLACAMLIAAGAMPAAAEVKESSPTGFTVSHVRTVPARPEQVWAALVQPARWWSGAHSWSGQAANFTLDPRVGGCFCERWADGEAEHARVIFVQTGKVLRLSGALGPLQAAALTGTLSFTLAPDGTGTRISVDYVVGGHAAFDVKAIAPAVDNVIGEQAGGLAKLLGG